MQTSTFERFGGISAFVAGLGGLAYSISFVIISKSAPQVASVLTPLFLLLGGLLTTAVLAALYGRLRENEAMFALWALLLGVGAALGTAAHGGYDLANAINPPTVSADFTNGLSALPSQVDPRGLFTFGIAGLALLTLSWLITRGSQFPQALGYLGYLSALLLIIIYLGRLIILDPKNPFLLGSAALEGFLVNPIWYLWLGLVLWHGQKAQSK